MVTRSSSLVLSATLIFSSACLSQTSPPQTPADQQPAPEPGPNATVLQTGTQLVVLDVVVLDSNGKPVHGLTAANFQVTENKIGQKISHAEEHTPPPLTTRGPDLGKMPPGTFTNYTPVAPGASLNILLLDALNTPMIYQTWVRDQLKKYLAQAPPGQRIAIFGLTDELILLQGFTSDPEILKNVVEHKLNARSSPLLADPVGTGADSNLVDQLAGSAIADSAAKFETETDAVATERRIQITLDAFNTLAHYLAAFPGRKNLIWFSGSFPTGVVANPSSMLYREVSVSSNEIADTAATLTAAQVAIYPIDARGLMIDTSMNPANNSSTVSASNARVSIGDIHSFFDSQAEEHATMESLASETGGHAFYNTNGITQAVQEAIQLGSNNYTLTYTPADHNWNNAYRSLHVNLVDVPGSFKLSYRSGYFAVPPKQPIKVDAAALSSGSESIKPGLAGYSPYYRASMTRGAPTPQDIIFKVRVLPASTETETKLVSANTLDPASPTKGAFRRYAVDYALLPSEITLTHDPSGNRVGQIKFIVYVYDPSGHLLVAAHRGFNLNLTPDVYQKFIKSALQCHMEISVPDRTDAYLRIAVQDIAADRFGAVEVPVTAIAKLPPAPGPAHPSTAPATPPAAPTH